MWHKSDRPLAAHAVYGLLMVIDIFHLGQGLSRADTSLLCMMRCSSDGIPSEET